MSELPKILIVEDNADWLEIYRMALDSDEYTLSTARTVKQASKLLDQQEFAVVATDLRLLGADFGGFDILEKVQEISPDTQVIIFTGVGGKQDAYEAMRRGAYDYVTKPLDYAHVKRVIKAAIDVRQQKIAYRQSVAAPQEVLLPFPEKFVGSSQVIRKVLRKVAEATQTTDPVLIVGATGTGKGLIAETIHLGSARRRFRLLNCTSLSETTLERILFGFKRGAFPGALDDELGALEEASGGTLVLDKVSGLSLRLQGQLCAALRHGRSRRIGESKTLDVDVRVIAISQVDLASYVEQGLFSKEFYNLLSASVIVVPPLRERKDEQTDDVLLLAGYFLDRFARGEGPPASISDEAKALLQAYHFPGNVWELSEAIRTALAQAKGGVIRPEHLPEQMRPRKAEVRTDEVAGAEPESGVQCPHGDFNCDKVAEIVKAYDATQSVYVRAPTDAPAWYDKAMRETLARHGLEPVYPDSVANPTVEFCQVCLPIQSSHLAVIDVSDGQPYLFYELGLAQAIGVPCGVLKQLGVDLPSNLEALGSLEYHDEASLRRELGRWFEDRV